MSGRASDVRFALAALAIALALLAAWFLRYGDLKWAIAPLAVSVGCLALAGIGTRRARGDSPTADADDFPIPTPLEARLGVAGFALASLFMFISLREFGGERDSFALAWWSFGLAIAAALLAIPAMDGRWTPLIARIRSAGGIRLSIPARAFAPSLALAAILVLAAGLRLYNLDSLPAGLWFDEADNLAHAREFARNPGRIPVYVPSTNLPSMFLIPLAAVVELAGVSMTAGRLAAAGFGLLGVVAVFLLGRAVGGTRVGLIAALLTAVMRWDIIWSRIGMHGITGVLFAALVGWLALRAVRSGLRSDYAFAGFALGLGMWFYSPFTLFPLALAALLAHHALVSRPKIRDLVGRVVIIALMAGFAAAPVAQFAASESDVFFERARTTSIFSIAPREDWAAGVADGFARHALMFHREGDPNARHNLPGEPMLDLLTGALFALGLLYALARRRDVRVFWLPFWAALMLIPGVLTVPWESPQSLRSILALPAVAVLSALALDALWRAWRGASWQPVRRAAPFAVLAALGIIAYLNADMYFGTQARDARVYAAFSTDETLMARSQIQYQSQGYSLWASRQFQFGLTSALLANRPKLEIMTPPLTPPFDSDRAWDGAAAYFEPRERGYWETARAYYPDARFETATAPGGGDPLYYAAFASRETLAARQGLAVSYEMDGEKIEGARESVSESAWYPYSETNAYPMDVTLEGAVLIPEFGEYGFFLDSPNTRAELNGLPLVSDETRSAYIMAAAGLHSLKISARIEDRDGYIRILWTPPDGGRAPIPFANLYRESVRPIGLAGRFFDEDPDDYDPSAPDDARVAPTSDMFHYSPVLPPPYSAIWEGDLTVALPGNQRFALETAGGQTAALYIEGALIARAPATEETASEGEVNLAPGRHRIRVERRIESGSPSFRVLWAPPGIGGVEPIPAGALSPAPERMFWESE